MKQEFETRLVAKGPKEAWTHLVVPFNVEATFGTKARIAVAGTLNGCSFRNSLMPIGDGTHYMNINRELQAAAKVSGGDLVQVVMDVDKAERTVEVPEALQISLKLKANKDAADFFASLPLSHKKAYTDWISSAKKDETKAARIEKAIEMLRSKKRRD